MDNQQTQLLDHVDAFLLESGMGHSYFGKASTGNSELVARLRAGGRVWPETEARIIDFISARRTGVEGSSGNSSTPKTMPKKAAKSKPEVNKGLKGVSKK